MLNHNACSALTNSTVSALNTAIKHKYCAACNFISCQQQESSPSITLNAEPEPFAGYGPIGWYVFRDGQWIPAHNEKISCGSRIALHIHGSAGELSNNLGAYLAQKNNYDVLLGFRYNPTIEYEKAGDFFAEHLTQLLNDTNFGVCIDIFAYSAGTVVTRWVLELQELGKYENINHVVLIGDANTGFYYAPHLILEEDSQIAAKLALFIYYHIIDPKIIGFSDKIPNQQIQTGVTQQPDDPHAATFLKLLMLTPVPSNIFNNLKYYILTGTDGSALAPLDLVELATGIDNVFAYAEERLQLGINPVAYRELYPTLGLLWRKAFVEPTEIALNRKLTWDGFISEASTANIEVPTSKSCFFANNTDFALRSVPLNHAQLVGLQELSLPDPVVRVLDIWLATWQANCFGQNNPCKLK